jgi:hypothetical protein
LKSSRASSPREKKKESIFFCFLLGRGRSRPLSATVAFFGKKGGGAKTVFFFSCGECRFAKEEKKKKKKVLEGLSKNWGKAAPTKQKTRERGNRHNKKK